MPARTAGPAALLATLLTAGCSVFGGQAAPEPDYEVVVSEPPFEIRRYPPLVVAQTTAGDGYDAALSEGFSRLFDYISGANGGEREIAMTAPVLTEPEGENGGSGEGSGEGSEIAMTAPVLTAPAEGEAWQVSFVLPGDYTLESAPRPTDERVRIARIPERRVAVVRFSWSLSRENVAENRARLAEWLEGRDVEPAGEWQAAGYNPPWTLPWLKRNEVLVPVE